jgi:hypothetical protein
MSGVGDFLMPSSTLPKRVLLMAAEESIRGRILLVRGHKVMLDSDLADVYGVAVKRLNEQVKRNRRRFPADFMFQLTAREASVLRSQFATSKTGRGGRRSRPYAFTEHGAVMLASVLNSVTAIGASILVVRAFVRLRIVLAAHKDLARLCLRPSRLRLARWHCLLFRRLTAENLTQLHESSAVKTARVLKRPNVSGKPADDPVSMPLGLQ